MNEEISSLSAIMNISHSSLPRWWMRVMNTVFITLEGDEYGIHHPPEGWLSVWVMNEEISSLWEKKSSPTLCVSTFWSNIHHCQLPLDSDEYSSKRYLTVMSNSRKKVDYPRQDVTSKIEYIKLEMEIPKITRNFKKKEWPKNGSQPLKIQKNITSKNGLR